ncbi:Beta-barrel assembly machine subunit BamA [Paucidesulfovibrio gracilis DSM 16080]|uniref:Outer membrane protein assembly factor BamA n=1 Tax=Paucidesulfovibrio gracilis DSM 16080 TaxID=1121449 RepID=A0A1T4WK03_9BACT|nr:outer membrane protein assembly factor BamA [Paucidesulfovibrio gracilis]SKA77509.1 Beta-barrel assembly machine subunit BamA [Paucidesulfovibrio gracilis DSM 16080]
MPNRRRCLALLATVFFLMLNGGSAWAQTSAAPKVAVLPFEVNAGDDLVYLEDSLPDLLSDRLNEAGFDVVAPDEVRRIVDELGVDVLDLAKAREIALMTGAGYALYGSFSQLGETLSMESRLVDAFDKEKATPIYAETEGIINLLPLVDDVVAQSRKVMLNQQPIAVIDVEGTKVLDPEVVLMRLRINKGDTYEPSLIDGELKNIYELGYFDDVDVIVSDVTGGKKVLFRVVEKPRIQALSVVGADELDEDDLLEAVATKKGAVLNLRVLRDDMNTIRAMYRTEGYYKTKVSYEVEGGETGQARLNFVVEEGPKLYIEEIVLDGAEQVDPDDLKDELALSESGILTWFSSSDVLNEELLERDSSAIKAYYANRGFMDVQVGRPEVDFLDDGIRVTFRIKEGTRLKIGNIQYKGDLIASPEELDEAIALDEVRAEEQFMNASTVREDVEALTALYSNKGYAYADVGVQFAKSSEDTLDVVYTLAKHQKVHIRRVLLEGNSETRDNVILREMRLSDGDTFSAEALENSVAALEGLGYFEGVDVEPIPTGDPDEMDLKVRVKEGPTGQIGGGFGFSSSGGFFVAGSIQENNLFGKGYHLNLYGSYGGDSNEFGLTFVDPHYDDQKWGYSLGVNRSVDAYDEYDMRDLSFSAALLYPLGDHTSSKFSYTASFYHIYDVEETASDTIKDEEGEHLLSAVTALLARSHLKKNSFFVSEGTAQSLSVTYAGDFLGGDDNFIKYLYDIDHYEPLFWNLSLRAHGNVAYMHENFSGDDLPMAQKFRLGGIGSVRGYASRKISPRDEDDEAVGGDKALYSNIELMCPLSKEYGILGIMFFDVGGVWDDDQMLFDDDLDSAEGDAPSFGLYKSVGLGGRWNSPMGPLEVYWGYGLDDLKDSASNRLEFRMGQSF